VINFVPESPVNPITLSPQSFQYLVMCKIVPAKDQTLTDDFFKKNLPALDAAVAQFSPAPISMEHRADGNMDNDFWVAEIGEGGFVGVTKKRRGANAYDYFVVAQCGAAKVGAKFIENIKAASPPMTWRQAAESQEMTYWRNAAARNACRLAFAASERLNVVIGNTDEDATYTLSDAQAPRKTALPEHRQFVSQIGLSMIKASHRRRLYICHSLFFLKKGCSRRDTVQPLRPSDPGPRRDAHRVRLSRCGIHQRQPTGWLCAALPCLAHDHWPTHRSHCVGFCLGRLGDPRCHLVSVHMGRKGDGHRGAE
jgi:hypothetical protein